MGTEFSGKRVNQKLKPYIVLQILQRETDENHVLSAVEIAAALDELGIEAERRSIYRDIEEINIVNWLLENEGSTIEDAAAAIKADKSKDRGTVLLSALVCSVMFASQVMLRLAPQ